MSENTPDIDNTDDTVQTVEDTDIDDRDRTRDQEEEAAINLDDPTATDDVPWSPPDERPLSARFADLENEDPAREETIDERILQEEPEEGTAYGAPGPDEAGEVSPDPDADVDPLEIDPEIDIERPTI